MKIKLIVVMLIIVIMLMMSLTGCSLGSKSDSVEYKYVNVCYCDRQYTTGCKALKDMKEFYSLTDEVVSMSAVEVNSKDSYGHHQHLYVCYRVKIEK